MIDEVMSDLKETVGFMKSTYISNWVEKKLRCFMCGETRSVKYAYKGMHYCNACIMQANVVRKYDIP